MRKRLKVFFDGGCRGAAGDIEVAVVAAGRTTIIRDLGSGASGDAEWLALIHGLAVAQATGVADFVLLGDSADVVGKANGVVKCRGGDIAYRDRFRALAAGKALRVRHIGRAQNLAGIALARLHPR